MKEREAIFFNLLLIMAYSVSAQARTYLVEVVVFSSKHNTNQENEIWPGLDSLPDFVLLLSDNSLIASLTS